MKRMYSADLVPKSVYGLLGLPFGVGWFIVFVTTMSVSFSLLIVVIGFGLMSLALRFAGVAADVERWMVRELLGVEIPAASRLAPSEGALAGMRDPIRDPSYWRELMYLLLRFPSGIIGFVITVAVWLFPVWALSTLFWGWFVFGSWTLLILIFGIASLALGPMLIIGFTEVQILLAQLLLGPSNTQLAERTRRVVVSRDRSVEAAEAERRRIERDLHDGAQARLSTVALDLGRAKRRLEQGGTAEELGQIIDSAHSDAKAAIVELRDLARGIHPAVLADRGLEAALTEVVSRCSVPIHLDVRIARRPPAHIEGAAYFAVCELVTNMSRHSSATNGWVTVRGNEERLAIEVSDDGIGGVDYSLGTGMTGLYDRVNAVDGSFSVSSPLGGGTTALIEVPIS